MHIKYIKGRAQKDDNSAMLGNSQGIGIVLK